VYFSPDALAGRKQNTLVYKSNGLRPSNTLVKKKKKKKIIRKMQSTELDKISPLLVGRKR